MRFELLSDEEKRYLCELGDGGIVTAREREKLNQLLSDNNQKKYDEEIKKIARTNYFRRFAWIGYLNGTATKPEIIKSG